MAQRDLEQPPRHAPSPQIAARARDRQEGSGIYVEIGVDATVAELSAPRLKSIPRGELRVLGSHQAREIDDHLGLLPGGVVLHLALEHHSARTVRTVNGAALSEGLIIR